MRRKQKTTIELSIPSTLGYEKIARDVAASLARGVGFDPERIADLQTAISEACINAIEHGNQCKPGLRISLTFTVTARRLEVVVSDCGIRRSPTPEPSTASIEQKIHGLANPRGMGLMLIHELVDESGFLPTRRGSGNRFRLTLYRQRSGTASRKSAAS
jgi:serine/threonine-protein kinase RsbW